MAEYPLTDAQILQIAYRVRGLIRAESKSIPEVPAVDSLEGLTSLPAILTVGGIPKYVRAPIDLLQGVPGPAPILTFEIRDLPYGNPPTASVSGTAARPRITIGFPLAKDGQPTILRKGADGIYSKLNDEPESAWQLLFSFTDVMPDVSDFSPEGIALLQKPATDAAREVREAEALRVTAEEKRVQAETSRVNVERERAMAETERASAERERETNTNQRLDNADDAIERMIELSDHRAYIGEDYYVYVWNEDTKAYDKTDTYLKGEGLNIIARFETLEALEAAFPEGATGLFEIGTVYPFDYYYWDAMAGVWRNSGGLSGGGGDALELPRETLIVTLETEQPEDAESLTGAEIKISGAGEEMTLTWEGEPLTVNIKASVDYTVAGQSISGLKDPEPVEFTSTTGYTRNLTLIYRPVPRTRIVFDKTISDSKNITGFGEGAIVDIIAKMRRCMVKKTAEGEVAICYLDNANSNLYADGSAAILAGGTEGDVMVYKPEFYYKYEEVDANRFAYTISEFRGGEDWIHSPASLIGAYKANNVSSKTYSRSGIASTRSVSITNYAKYAQARGAGYNIIDFEQHCMIALLFYAKYGNRNSQAVLGVGNATQTAVNGSTDSLGNADTVAVTTGHASFAGIEGVHGCAYEWVGGVTILDGVWTITNPDGTTRNGNAPAALATGYITEIAAALGPFFDVIPTTNGGSATTRYADYYYYSAGSRVLARSGNSAHTGGGVSFTYASHDASLTYTSIASRLTFRERVIMRPLPRRCTRYRHTAERGASPLGEKHQISNSAW